MYYTYSYVYKIHKTLACYNLPYLKQDQQFTITFCLWLVSRVFNGIISKAKSTMKSLLPTFNAVPYTYIPTYICSLKSNTHL